MELKLYYPEDDQTSPLVSMYYMADISKNGY